MRDGGSCLGCELGGAWLRGVCAVARGASRSARRFRPRRLLFFMLVVRIMPAATVANESFPSRIQKQCFICVSNECSTKYGMKPCSDGMFSHARGRSRVLVVLFSRESSKKQEHG